MNELLALLQEYYKYYDVSSGSIISATVISINNRFVTIRTGLKSDTCIPVEEFLNHANELEIKVGVLVPVYIESLESADGNISLSRIKSKKLTAWVALENSLNHKEYVVGVIVNRVKGGMTVVVNGLAAFLPGSLVDLKPVKDAEKYEGKKFKFHVIKLDKKRNNIVLSRRSVLETHQLEKRKKLFSSLKEDVVVRGSVKNITDYGAFIDLGGLDGLLHITDISWRRIKHPSNVLSLGDFVTVKVLKFDRVKKRVSLGLKQLHSDPWDGVIERYPPGHKVRGKITNIADYGAFVEIEPGIEGLVHISEMYWKNKNTLPNKLLKIGQPVNVSIIDISKTRRRISLGMKQCIYNPWLIFSKLFRKNDRLGIIIRSFVDLGIYVDLPMAVSGLIYLPRFVRKKLSNYFSNGDVLETTVVNIDNNYSKVSLISSNIFNDRFFRYIECKAGYVFKKDRLSNSMTGNIYHFKRPIHIKQNVYSVLNINRTLHFVNMFSTNKPQLKKALDNAILRVLHTKNPTAQHN